MKRFVVVLLSLLIAGVVFANGASESAEETYDLILVDTGATPWSVAPGIWDTKGHDSFQDLIVAEFRESHPNVNLEYIHRDVTQGSLTVDALMTKGTPPDVWLDAAGYFREYLNEEYSLPLEQYLDVDLFLDDLVAPYTRDGHVYALPVSNNTAAMAVNLTILDEIGYTLPPTEEWTTDEFVKLAGKLKGAGYPATAVMTEQGLISWMIVWLYAFGAELYADGDYSQVAINSPEAKAGLEYIKMLVDKGFTPPYPNEVNDDMGVELFTTGKIFSVMLQTVHADYWIPEQVKNGVIDEAFEYTFIEFPHAPGRDHTPVYAYQTVVNAHRSDDEARNRIVADLLWAQVGPGYQQYVATMQGGFPTLKDFDMPTVGTAAKPSYQAMVQLAPVAGVMDLGGLHPRAKEVMGAAKVLMQRFMDGDITAQELLDRWETDANRILAD